MLRVEIVQVGAHNGAMLWAERGPQMSRVAWLARPEAKPLPEASMLQPPLPLHALPPAAFQDTPTHRHHSCSRSLYPVFGSATRVASKCFTVSKLMRWFSAMTGEECGIFEYREGDGPPMPLSKQLKAARLEHPEMRLACLARKQRSLFELGPACHALILDRLLAWPSSRLRGAGPETTLALGVGPLSPPLERHAGAGSGDAA